MRGRGRGGLARPACARSAWQQRRKFAATLAGERHRVRVASDAWSLALAARQREHATEFRAWQRRRAVFDRQPAWFAVGLPAGIDRVDVAGGTLAGWSALVTMIAAPRLSTGGEVSVVDLTEGAVAGDLVSLAHRIGLEPLVWALPGDLPRLDLGPGLDAQALADVLALAAAAASAADRAGQLDQAGQAGDGQAADPAADCALLERVLAVLGPDPRVASVTAALRALADVGDPRDDVRSGLLTTGQLEQVGKLFGRGAAERVVMERAFLLEARLRRLDALGPASRPGQLRRCGCEWPRLTAGPG